MKRLKERKLNAYRESIFVKWKQTFINQTTYIYEQKKKQKQKRQMTKKI